MRFKQAAIVPLIVLMCGCAGTSSPAGGGPPGSSSSKGAGPRGTVGRSDLHDSRIYFDYDSSTLKRDGRMLIKKWGEYLSTNAEARVSLEGHADERGTPEYNIGLGERRALSARDALIEAGVRPEQLRVVSYGEERPLQSGRGESAWSKNRRVEIVLQ